MGLFGPIGDAVISAGSSAISAVESIASAPAKLAEMVSDELLPPELEFVGDLVSGGMNFMSGNYLSTADDVGDLLGPTKLNLDGLAPIAAPEISAEPTEPVLQNNTVATPAAVPAEPTVGTAGTASAVTTAPAGAPSASDGATKTDGKGMSQAAKDFLNLSGPDMMAAIRNGTIPDAIFDDPKAMNMLQMKIQQMSQMSGLLSQLSSAMHQMQQAIIHNVRA